MIKTALLHALAAVIAQLVLWPALGLTASGAVAVAYWVGWEMAQRSYKLSIHRGWEWGDKHRHDWWEPMAKGWSLDSLLDLVFPIVAVLAVAVLGNTL